jgi:hypothetical protein
MDYQIERTLPEPWTFDSEEVGTGGDGESHFIDIPLFTAEQMIAYAKPFMAEFKQLRKDAARYRWLRDRNDWYAEPRIDEKDGTKWELAFYTSQRIEDPTDDNTLDAAVDAAIADDASK